MSCDLDLSRLPFDCAVRSLASSVIWPHDLRRQANYTMDINDVSLNDIHERHFGIVPAFFLILNRIIGTGIFSIPSGIYELTGSIGWSILFWVLGGCLAASGFTVYLEYGLEMPENGAEKNYLERVYRHPQHLLLTMFVFSAVFLTLSSSNSYAFGLYLQLGFGFEPTEEVTRYIGALTVIVICVLHAVFPHVGRSASNLFGVCKLAILLLIAFCVPLIYFGILKVPNRPNNFENLFKNDGFGGSAYEISVALLRVSFSYRGWETCNMVMKEVRNPSRTLKIAGILAISTITALYTFCSVAYFMVVQKDEIISSGATIAGIFLFKVFGESATSHLLPMFICLSNFGNILVVCYAASRVTQELGKHNIMPFSRYISSQEPWNTPLAGLLIHAVMSTVTILAPPPGEVYEFIVDVSTYPVSLFAMLVSLGLLYLHANAKAENWRPQLYRAPNVCVLFFSLANMVMVIFPWVPPPHPISGALPYFASPLGAVLTLGLGAIYWVYCRQTGRVRSS